MSGIDVIELSKKLISFPSISPDDKGAIKFLSNVLEKLGFECHILEFGDSNVKVRNLYAKYGVKAPNLCFAGHVDVVPPGDITQWVCDPFQPEIKDNVLYGRGAVDMKCAVCAFVSAVSKLDLKKIEGTISFLITSDEEGANFKFGTPAILAWLKENDIKLDFCIVGEATSSVTFGDIVKIGRRGAVTFEIECNGIQGHVAYPELALNPINNMIDILYKIRNTKFDEGNEFFQPTNCEITTVDVNNPTSNVIPDKIIAKMNIRFCTEHSFDSLYSTLDKICSSVTDRYKITKKGFGDVFLTKPNKYADMMVEAIFKRTGVKAKYSTSGGTSDARFIKDHCSVIEFGLINKTAHHMNENTPTEHVYQLTNIYEEYIKMYFSSK